MSSEQPAYTPEGGSPEMLFTSQHAEELRQMLDQEDGPSTNEERHALSKGAAIKATPEDPPTCRPRDPVSKGL